MDENRSPWPGIIFLIVAGILLYLLASGCSTEKVVVEGIDGPAGEPGTPGSDGSSCSVERREAGALLSCSDGSSAFVYDGAPGRDGESGAGCEVEQVESCLVVSCSDASIAEVCSGVAGEPGADGQDGVGCSVEQDVSGVTITCGDDEAFISTPAAPPSPTNGVVCHNGNTLTIPAAAVPAHLAHGDTLGACP